MKTNTVLLTGARGLVGSALKKLLAADWEVITPDRKEFDLLTPSTIFRYIQLHKPKFIIHAGAYVAAGDAEKERGKEQGICWKTNVSGTLSIVDAAKALGIFSCYISTGSVFHGTADNPGPFKESDMPIQNAQENGWYGYTKYLGETTGPDAIIRISHPVVPDALRIKDDYIQKIRHMYEEGKLFPLFFDQLFPLTYIGDLAAAIDTIFNHRYPGVFHVASSDLVSPYELTLYIMKRLKRPIDERIQKISIEEFYKNGNSPLRFAQFSALSSSRTQEKLKIKFLSWKETVATVFP